VVAGLEQAGARQAGQPRKPGGLRGAMHTHEDFDAPLDEAFLQP